MTSLLTGAVLYLPGRFRLGNLSRFIPYPVVGGFLSGSGWLLVLGSLRVMTGENISPAYLSKLIEPGIIKLWLPGVTLGLLLFLVVRIYKKTIFLPLILLGSMVAFYAVAGWMGISTAEARTTGWLPISFTGKGRLSPALLLEPQRLARGELLRLGSRGCGLAATARPGPRLFTSS